MGGGDDYVMQFGNWFNALSDDERAQYRQMFPEPRGWVGWYDDEFRGVMDENLIVEWEKDGLPRYLRSKLLAQLESGTASAYLLFWGHQPQILNK